MAGGLYLSSSGEIGASALPSLLLHGSTDHGAGIGLQEQDLLASIDN